MSKLPERDRSSSNMSSQPVYVKRQKSSFWLIVAVMAIFAAVVIYFWKDHEVTQAKNAFPEAESKMQARIGQQFEKNTEYYLSMTGRPLVWAIRSAMLDSNMDEVNQYLHDFIKEKGVQVMIVTDGTGKILSSTDEKLEGQMAQQQFPTFKPDQADITVQKQDSVYYTLTAPIMGLTNRLGSLYFEYKPDRDMINDIFTND